MQVTLDKTQFLAALKRQWQGFGLVAGHQRRTVRTTQRATRAESDETAATAR